MKHLVRMSPSTTVTVLVSPANIQYMYSGVLACPLFHCISIYLCHVSQQAASVHNFYWLCKLVPHSLTSSLAYKTVDYSAPKSFFTPETHKKIIFSNSPNWDTNPHDMNIAEICVYLCNYDDIYPNASVVFLLHTEKWNMLIRHYADDQ